MARRNHDYPVNHRDRAVCRVADDQGSQHNEGISQMISTVIYMTIGGLVPVGFLFVFVNWKRTENLGFFAMLALSFGVGIPLSMVINLGIALALLNVQGF